MTRLVPGLQLLSGGVVVAETQLHNMRQYTVGGTPPGLPTHQGGVMLVGLVVAAVLALSGVQQVAGIRLTREENAEVLAAALVGVVGC